MAARRDRKLGTMDGPEGEPAGRKPMTAGNWKMNLNHLEAIALTQKIAFSLTEAEFDAVEVVVLPPFTDLRSVQTLVEGDRLPLAYGAQDLSVHDSGAYTGEISGAMLAKLGCSYVLVGHSERRQYHGEDDALVNDKVHAAFRHGLVPLVCVGEGLDVRWAGEHVPFTLAQVRTAVKGVPPEQAPRLVVAYEPVWAIGTGESAQPEDAQEMAAAVRGELGQLYSAEVSRQVRILYGGSVKGATCPGIMTGADVDGALVGGASLSAEDFTDIVRFEREHA